MGAAFVKTAETVGTERLKNSGVDVSIIMLEKSVAIDLGVFGDAIEIVIEKLLTAFGREVGLCVEEERGQGVLECAFSAALIVENVRFGDEMHDVAWRNVEVDGQI